MSDSTVHSQRAAEPVGAYAHARKAGGLIFVAGMGPRRRGVSQIPGARVDGAGALLDYDIEAEVRACMDNVRIVLEEAGSSWDRIVDVMVFLTDMERDFAVYNRVYAEYFPKGPRQPTRTTIGVTALPKMGDTPIHVELKVVAEA